MRLGVAAFEILHEAQCNRSLNNAENLAGNYRQQMVQHRRAIALAREQVVANDVTSDKVFRDDALRGKGDKCMS